MNNEKQEFIEKNQKWITAYKNTIESMNKEIEKLLDGKELKTTDENGMPKFHEKHVEIKKINFEIAQIKSRLSIAEENLKEALTK